MGVTLNIVTPTGTALSITATAEVIRIGRASSCEVRLPYPNVSAVHVELTRRSGTWTAKDLGSRNGTRLDGVPLPPGHEARLDDQSVLELGNVQVRVSLAPYEHSGTFTLTDSGALLRKLVADALERDVPLASVVNANGQTATVPNFAADVRPEGEDFTIDRYEDGFWLTPDSDGVRLDGDMVTLAGARLTHGAMIQGRQTWTFRDPLAEHLDDLEDPEHPEPITEKPTPRSRGGLDWMLILGTIAVVLAAILAALVVAP